MYKLTTPPAQVHHTLQEHLLTDGLDLVFDMEKSQGSYLFDSKNDRKLLDFFTCFASVPLGYNHPKMVNDEAFKKNLLLAALNNPSNSDVYTQQFAEFMKTFSRVGIPSYLPHVFLISGGTLAVENALKTAMDWKVQKNFQKGYKNEVGHQVLHFTHAFHGRSGYTLSLTNTKAEKTKWYAKFPWPRVSTPSIKFPLSQENLPSLIKKEQNAIQEIKSAFVKNKDDICAILIEPILSEGGDLHLRDEFFIQLRELADENEALLIYDEVQTGVGLTGKFWCHEHFGEYAKPDILVFGKKMQVCGILASKRVDEIPSNVFNVSSRINSTWGGNLTDMVRSTKILQIIEEDGLVEKANQTGNFLVEQLKKLTMHSSLIQQVRGKGLQVAFDLPNAQTRDMIIQEGLKNNVLFLACGQKSIRFRPALTIDEREISEGISRLDTILKGISDV